MMSRGTSWAWKHEGSRPIMSKNLPRHWSRTADLVLGFHVVYIVSYREENMKDVCGPFGPSFWSGFDAHPRSFLQEWKLPPPTASLLPRLEVCTC